MCVQAKMTFFLNFLSDCLVESTNTAHTTFRSESKSQYQENENEHFAALGAGKQDCCFRAIKSGNAKKNACVEEALTIYLDENNPCIPSHMPTNTSQSPF